MSRLEKTIMRLLSKTLRAADKVIGSSESKRASILDTIPDINEFTHMEGTTDLCGKPFFFDMLNFRYSWLKWLVEKIVIQDCYLLGNIENSSPVVLDIGSHIGVFSRHVLSTKHNATVYAFEPDLESFSFLERNLSFFEKGFAIQKGVLDNKSRMDFYKSPSGYGWRGMPATGKQFSETKYSEGKDFAFKHTVELIDIDSFCRENGIEKIDLIKIHVPGKTEYLVLEGAKNTIEKFHPQVGIKVFPENFERVKKHMTQLGYQELPNSDNGPPFLKLYVFEN